MSDEDQIETKETKIEKISKDEERINSAKQTKQQLQFHFKHKYAFTRAGKTKRS